MAGTTESCLVVHAIAVPADLQANDTETKSLDQDFGVGRIEGDVSHDQRAVVVATVDSGERVGARGAEQTLRQLLGLADAKQPLTTRAVAADHGGRAIAAAP